MNLVSPVEEELGEMRPVLAGDPGDEGALATALPQVDLEARLITVQRSFDGPTKADDVRYVPVLDPLLPVLRAWRLRHPGRLVFTSGLTAVPPAPTVSTLTR